jgi:hypothetical protein
MNYFQTNGHANESQQETPQTVIVTVGEKALYDQFPKILEYLYGKNLDITEVCISIEWKADLGLKSRSDMASCFFVCEKTNAFPLLALARKYEIETLSTLIYTYITTSIQRGTVLRVLKARILILLRRLKSILLTLVMITGGHSLRSGRH